MLTNDSVRAGVPVALSGHSRTRQLTVAALVTGLLAASAWLSIPIGAVPVTLQVFVVLLAMLLLRPLTAGAALSAYLIMGALGIPVFSGGLGGFGVLAGPTGGYLVGFLLAALLGALLREVLERRGARIAADVSAVVLSIAVIYIVGWTWLRIATGLDAGAAFAAGVAPFVVADAIKGAVAIGIAKAVRRSGAI